jgi:hypothetical protein
LDQITNQVAYEFVSFRKGFREFFLVRRGIVLGIPSDERDRGASIALRDIDHSGLLTDAYSVTMLVLITLQDDDAVGELIDPIRSLFSTISMIDNGVSGGAF